MKKILSALIFLLLTVGPVYAQQGAVFPTPYAGNTVPGTVPLCLNSSGQAIPASSGTCNLNANIIGAVDSAGRVDVTPVVQNAQYVSGNDIGSLVSFALPRTATGLFQGTSLQFIGGATTPINAFCFDSNPTGSTFTDKGTFSIAAADEAKRINKVGLTLTPSAATGDSVTAASQDNMALPFNSTATIYCAYSSTATFTPASATDMRVSIRFIQGAQ